MQRKPITEAQLDAMSNDGRLSSIAMRAAIDAGNDWPSLNGDEQDEWHKHVIRLLRSGEISRVGANRRPK